MVRTGKLALLTTRRSQSEVAGRGPQFPAHTPAQRPKGRCGQSPWQHISNHPPPKRERAYNKTEKTRRDGRLMNERKERL